MTRLGHLMQNASDRMFWAGHNGNDKLRVFSWADGPNDTQSDDVKISPYAPCCDAASFSLTPDGNNWLGKAGDSILGATGAPIPGAPGAPIPGAPAAPAVWFAWTAAPDYNFPEAHIEMVSIQFEPPIGATNPLGLQTDTVEQVQIWNPNVAFAYPALATNECTGEVGLSLLYGGGNVNYVNHAVGFWGDFVVYNTTASDVGTARVGDYVTIRRVPATAVNLKSNLFTAFGYGLNKVHPPASGLNTDVHYVLFGRPISASPTSCEAVIPQ